MTYESYIRMSREALLAKMETVMPEKRLRHCLGVEKAARELAERFSLDVEKAGLAGLLHDYAKKVSDEEFLALIDKYQLDPTNCVFLDDIEDNAIAAEKVGIKAYQVKKRSDVVEILKSYI